LTTESFIITYNNKKVYLDIDRTCKYKGITLYENISNEIYKCTYLKEFNLKHWLKIINITDGILTMTINDYNDGYINSSIKRYDILTLIIKNKEVVEIKNSKKEIIYRSGDNNIYYFCVGWFGKVFDYYTNIITERIADYSPKYDRYIWGVSC
jgi:hypothetical protein